MDSADLLVGLLLALGIPLVTWAGMEAAGVSRKGVPEVPEPGEVNPAPDASELDLRLGRVRGMLHDNALEFLRRAETARGQRQIRELRWAHQALTETRAELTDLRHLLRSTDALGRYPEAVQELDALASEIEEGIETVRQLDRLDTVVDETDS